MIYTINRYTVYSIDRHTSAKPTPSTFTILIGSETKS